MRWYPIDEAAKLVFSGEIVNALAVAGILAAYMHRQGFTTLRPVDAEWADRPTAFAARKNRS